MPELIPTSPVSDRGPPPRPRPLPNPNLCNAELSAGVKKIDEAIVRNSKEEVDTLLVVVSARFAASSFQNDLTADLRPDCFQLSKVPSSLSRTNNSKVILRTSPSNENPPTTDRKSVV